MLPDAWQTEAVQALNAGRDVIVDAPTGAGKTYVFERWLEQGNFGSSAVFTVPTRALANDKYAEWREQGWRVGIVTGDVTIEPTAPVVVATLEAVQGELTHPEAAPANRLLVVDEYQWLADSRRGSHYEGVLMAVPPSVQLLLLSGSISNPTEVGAWLARMGRDPQVVSVRERPVPLDEVDVDDLVHGLPKTVAGFWAKRLAGALREGLGPVLVFAPHRRDAERLARQFSREIPLADPLRLTTAQEQAAGPMLTKLLRQRIAFHHSGLTYGQRAGVIEPLAKAGQLRAVVATLGLSAGVNFSLRSVMLTAGGYQVNRVEHEITPDELLQMAGRAGRRGLDDTGHLLVSGRTPRLRRAAQKRLKRAVPLPWMFLLRGLRLGDSIDVSHADDAHRFFSRDSIRLGREETGQLEGAELPCGQRTDTGRARVVRRRRNPFKGCRGCEWREACKALSPEPTLWWSLQRTGVLDRELRLTARGAIAVNFMGPEGLALAVALEDRRYNLDSLLYDVANLFGGDRFAGTNPRRLGRLVQVCEKTFRRFDFPGFLDEGVPVDYGSGADEVVQAVVERTARAGELVADLELAGRGDVDRLMIEWRSFLRQVARAPAFDPERLPAKDLRLAERWDLFRGLCASVVDSRPAPGLPAVPALTAEQRRPIEHRFRRLS